MKHREVYTVKTKVAGREMKQRKKYCVYHGSVDLLTVGGELNWQARHKDCDKIPTDLNEKKAA